MASLSASNIIFFILAILAAASVAGAMVVSVQDISNAMVTKADSLSDQMKSDITVINDPEDATQNSDLILYVKNTGEKSLPADKDNVDVFLDGKYITDITTDLHGGGNWDPGKVLIVNATTIDAGDHRVKVSVVGGVSDEFQFRE